MTRRRNRRASPATEEFTIYDFFAPYPEFDYDASKPVMPEFERLCAVRSWGPKKRRKVYHRLQDGLSLCEEVRISPIPSSIKQCRKALARVHVNLYDLIDARRLGKRVKVFRSLPEMRNYTLQTGRIFPKDRAKAGGVLRALLREIF
ncbi:unnamed protein product [Somion occarium]|uniref:Uncharacterized protein n=1 Tax=Somion occarium TaxID=3059160 RepID=A0ABP1CUP3_9APHY